VVVCQDWVRGQGKIWSLKSCKYVKISVIVIYFPRNRCENRSDMGFIPVLSLLFLSLLSLYHSFLSLSITLFIIIVSKVVWDRHSVFCFFNVLRISDGNPRNIQTKFPSRCILKILRRLRIRRLWNDRTNKSNWVLRRLSEQALISILTLNFIISLKYLMSNRTPQAKMVFVSTLTKPIVTHSLILFKMMGHLLLTKLQEHSLGLIYLP